jgi:hypothetical protein
MSLTQARKSRSSRRRDEPDYTVEISDDGKTAVVIPSGDETMRTILLVGSLEMTPILIGEGESD